MIGILSDSINVAWQKPEHPNGVIVGYIITWKNIGRSKKTFGKVTLLNETLRKYLISSLSKSTYKLYCLMLVNCYGKYFCILKLLR